MTRRSKLPLLGPGADLLRTLEDYSVEELREVATARGLEVSPDATHLEICNRLVRERFRTGVDELYAVQDNCFLNVDEYLPFISSFIEGYRPRRITELGCGTGLLASWVASWLAPDGVYLGSDFSESGVDRANERMRDDPRFTFVTADAESAPLLEDTDCILFPWVLNWLDTHAAERIWIRLAAVRPAPIVISCVHLRGCVEKREGVTADEATQLDAAERYLRGERAPGLAIWDTERYDCYLRSLEEHFEILAHSVQPGAHIFWAKRSRGAAQGE